MDDDDFDCGFTGDWRRAPMSRAWAWFVLIVVGGISAWALFEALTQ